MWLIRLQERASGGVPARFFAVTDSSMQAKIDDLRHRKEAARQAGSERSVQRQHDKGKMLARERIDYLLDPGSFHELDMLARHRAPDDAGLAERPYTDGVITGWGDRKSVV